MVETTSIGGPWLLAGFLGFVVAMLAVDLGVFHRQDHEIRAKEALGWSVFWVSLALVFNLGVWHWFGAQRGLEFLSAYLIEKSLSVDNVFVFVVIFAALGIPAKYQHRVLFWGILSALVLRGAMILAGAALLARFHWLMYVFGAFLLLTGVKLLFAGGQASHPEESPVYKLLQRLVPSSPRLDGNHFLTRDGGRWLATPLLMALLLVEVSDVIFAVDSIPAVFAVTSDPFIVFTSNVFAILGLRSLYFLLAGVVHKFRYLKPALAVILMFVGVKMGLVDLYKVPASASLAVIVAILAAAVVLSLWKSRREEAAGAEARRAEEARGAA